MRVRDIMGRLRGELSRFGIARLADLDEVSRRELLSSVEEVAEEVDVEGSSPGYSRTLSNLRESLLEGRNIKGDELSLLEDVMARAGQEAHGEVDISTPYFEGYGRTGMPWVEEEDEGWYKATHPDRWAEEHGLKNYPD